MTGRPQFHHWRLRLAWALQLLLAVIFTITAYRKFVADPVPVATVEALGTGQWLRVAIGFAELAGAIGLLMPRLVPLAASCLALLMVGDVGTHLAIVGGSAVPALVLAVACIAVALLRLDEGNAEQNADVKTASRRSDASLKRPERCVVWNGWISVRTRDKLTPAARCA